MLKVYDELPRGFLEAQPATVADVLGGPSLIHLPGLRPEPLFVSVLLHGNETVGLLAVQEVLRNYHQRRLPRALSLFVGNVEAARHGLRRLDGQPDYNRVWPGAEADNDSPEAVMMAQVVDEMARRQVFASIDVHNNTGLNPHYGCVNRLDGRFLHLASLFSRTVVYFTRPRGVQSIALAELCPAVTVECGQVGNPEGLRRAREFIEAGLHLSAIPERPAETELAVYHTVATIKVPDEVSFSFGDDGADLRFLDDLEQLNFHDLPVGTTLACVAPGGKGALRVEGEGGEDATRRFLSHEDGEVRTRRHVMPAMFSHDERVIRQDCVGYLMERVELP